MRGNGWLYRCSLLVLLLFFICCNLLIISTTHGRLNGQVHGSDIKESFEEGNNIQEESGDVVYHDDGEYDHEIVEEEGEEIGEYNEGEQEGEEEEEERDLYADAEEEEDVDSRPRLTEEERVAEYHKRGYVWPIPDNLFVPNTTEFVRHMRNRIEQIDKIDDPTDRWTGIETIATTGILVPNFTEHGFGITKCIDEELMELLRTTIREGYENGLALPEGEDIIMPGPNPNLLIRDRDDLTTRVYKELQRYAEAWSGMKLIPYGAYGFRIYQNGTQLFMHIDRPKTHIISFILHIDHSNDGSPWPLVIEDYHGNTHEVTLTSGDLLFYESAKLLHGRPRPFNGTWYCSVFVHYYPAHGWKDSNIELESSVAVPPNWEGQLTERDTPNLPKLKLYETGFTEPECEHQWCGLQNSIKWGGPAEGGYWMAPNMEKYPLSIGPYIPILDEEIAEEGEVEEL